MTERQLREGWMKCIENVQNLLYGAKLLLSNDKSYRYAIGLYMFSVEEFGKALLLKKCFTQNRQKMYAVPKWIFGKDPMPQKKTINNRSQCAHYRKLEEGFNNLPSECKKLSKGIKISYGIDSTRTFHSTKELFIKKIKPSDKDVSISIPAEATGFFSDTVHFFLGKDEIEFDLKTASFYMDWDKANNRWKFMIPTAPYQLRKNIKLFEQKLSTLCFE